MTPKTTEQPHLVRRFRRGESIKVVGSPLIERTHNPEGRAKAIEALRSFDNGDHEEQRETWEIIKAALDRDAH